MTVLMQREAGMVGTWSAVDLHLHTLPTCCYLLKLQINAARRRLVGHILHLVEICEQQRILLLSDVAGVRVVDASRESVVQLVV